MNKNQIIIGTISLVILISGAVYVSMLQDVRIKVDSDKSTFYIWDNGRWIISGVEYNKLYKGTSLCYRSVKDINISVDINLLKNTTIITRTVPYKGKCEGAIIKDIYTFDGRVDSKELFPMSHTVTVINATGLIYQYEVRKLEYDGETKPLVGNYMDFGKNMKVEWDDEYYWGKVYKSGILKVRYKPNDNYKTYNIRLFDPPPTPIGFEELDEGKVWHIWNKWDDYYFNATSGMQFTNHYNEYWTHNVFCGAWHGEDDWDTLFFDDFETWSITEDCIYETEWYSCDNGTGFLRGSDADVYEGSISLRVSKGNEDNILVNNLDTSDFEDLNMSMYLKKNGLDAGEFCKIDAQQGLSGWGNVYDSGEGTDASYNYLSFNLTEYISDNTSIRIYSNASGNNEGCGIDLFNITGLGNTTWKYTCNDELPFKWVNDTDDETYVNITGSKNKTIGQKKIRFTLTYHLDLNDTRLSVKPKMENIGDIDIDKTLGFVWKMNNIQIGNTTENDSLVINTTTYNLTEDLDLTFVNMSTILNGETIYLPYLRMYDNSTLEYLTLKWKSGWDYTVYVKSKPAQVNAPIILLIEQDGLDIGQTKQGTFYWHDAESADWEDWEAYSDTDTDFTTSIWKNQGTDTCDWIADSAGTASSNTGPGCDSSTGYDHTIGDTTGMYVYLETSSGYCMNLGEDAHLNFTDELDGASNSYNISFWVHMYGSVMGNLTLDVFNGSWQNEYWSQVGNNIASCEDPYQYVEIDLSEFDESFYLRLRGISGGDYYSDMAIDDINVTYVPRVVDSDGPNISDATFNETSISPNGAVLFKVNVTDSSGVDKVNTTFRYPDTSKTNITLSPYYETQTPWGSPDQEAGEQQIKAGIGTGETREVFTSSDTFTVPAGITSVQVLVVAGGGGGGYSGSYGTGGGGAGGVIYNDSYPVTPEEGITVTIGSGGAGSTSYSVKGGNGDNSVFGDITAIGGGGGSSSTDSGGGADGGSGGGGGYSKVGGSGTAGQGNDGGDSLSNDAGGGGGGKGAAGADGSSAVGGNGGVGYDYGTIFGTDVGESGYFGGGGGGGASSGGTAGTGGTGGGGNGQVGGGTAAESGITNTGGGGGAGCGSGAGNGGSGIVIVIYSSEGIDSDGNSSWTEYTSIGGSDFDNITNIEVTTQVVYYDPRGSDEANNNTPDLEVGIYNGASYTTGLYYNINETMGSTAANTTDTNFTVSITDSTILNAWETASNRRIELRGVFFDTENNQNDTINYTIVFVTVSYENSTDYYSYIWTDTSTTGTYNVTQVWANDTLGNINSEDFNDVGFEVVSGEVPDIKVEYGTAETTKILFNQPDICDELLTRIDVTPENQTYTLGILNCTNNGTGTATAFAIKFESSPQSGYNMKVMNDTNHNHTITTSYKNFTFNINADSMVHGWLFLNCTTPSDPLNVNLKYIAY